MPAQNPPFATVLKWMATITVGGIGSALLGNFVSRNVGDFLSFWAAGAMALEGHAAASYDPVAHHHVQERVVTFTGWLPFGYPPPFLFFLLPIGLMPYALAAVTWTASTLAFYVLAARRLFKGWMVPALAFPPVLLNGVIGQNGFWTASLFLGGIALLAERPVVAGILLGTLAIKPQLAVLIPIALIAGREWRALGAAILTGLFWIVSSLAVFGTETWRAFLTSLSTFAGFARDGSIGWSKMTSVYASARLAGLSETAAWIIHGAGILAGLMFVWQVWRNSRDPLIRAAALVPATLLVSPYLYFYDQIILIAPLIWLARQGTNRWLLASLFVLPVLTIAQLWLAAPLVNLSALLTLASLALVWREWRRSQGRSGGT
jgi:alpha-1,2-mannosyltransferase